MTVTDRIVLYTAISGHYDSLKEQPAAATADVERVAFLDQPLASPTWRYRPMHAEFPEADRNAKIHKILPHRYFADARYSLWIDGSTTIRFEYPIARMIETYLADADIAVFAHWARICAYQEASVCLHAGLDDPRVIWEQTCRYRRDGFPANAGLAECTVLLRRHTAAVEAFNEAWWEEIRHGSSRDQLSFNYVAWRLGLRYATFPGSLEEDSALFQREPHRGTRDRALASDDRTAGAAATGWGISPASTAIVTPPAHIPPADAVDHPTRARSADRASPPNLALPRRPTIAFGPVRRLPSWDWVGFDTARELSRRYEVQLFYSWERLPACDVLFAIKEHPPDQAVRQALRAGMKLVYCPIDGYLDAAQVANDASLFRSCAAVLVHSERLLPFIQPHCANVRFVEHHARFALERMASYQPHGFILWIGGFQYVPYLLHWLERHPIAPQVRLLTDLDNRRARVAARLVARQYGVTLDVAEDGRSVSSYPAYAWTERRQRDLMTECKAALDVKMTAEFDQYLKPPTKAQQFVASGIPFAVNPDSYSAEYLRQRGFEPASPDDPQRWLSFDYWEATRRFGQQLRAWTSIETVAATYQELIESLLDEREIASR